MTRGPRENRSRLFVDALFRSMAYTYGPRVISVVLTGYLDDGTSGLWSVQRMGVLVIVQDPHDAEQPSMPTNALEFVQADCLVLLAERSQSALSAAAREPVPGGPVPARRAARAAALLLF